MGRTLLLTLLNPMTVTQAHYLNLSKFAEVHSVPLFMSLMKISHRLVPVRIPEGHYSSLNNDVISPSSENMWDGTDLSSPETCCSANVDSIQEKGN